MKLQKDDIKSGLIDATTMRKFDAQCLEPAKKMSKAEIKKIRLMTKVSQKVFSDYLNVSPNTVKKWESGENTLVVLPYDYCN